MRLSILDYVPVDEGFEAQDALAASLRLAQAADAAGLHRYWFSEHHGMPAMVSVAAQLRDLGRAYGTDKVMVNLMMPGEAARQTALTSLAQALDITPRAAAA